jgi:integrase
MSRGSTGNITRRGERSWRIKFDIGRDPITDKRRTQFATVRGTKKDAQAELTRRLNEVEEGQFVTRSAGTVADYAQHWIDTIAPARTGAKTRERYREIIEKHIIPQIGGAQLQKLDGAHIDEFYNHLRVAGRRDGKGGLAAQTVQHIHRLLSQILASAVKAKKLRASPMAGVQTTPKVRREEVQVLDDAELTKLFRQLKGRPLYMPVMVAASTGMRRGEVLALRWRDLDLDAASLQVAQVVELTKQGIALKEPKTDRSRRTIALPARLVQELRSHRREQSETRLRFGLGKDERDLVFPSWDWKVRNPSHFTKEFSREVAAAKLPRVTFHGLRHTHITHLLRSGIPVHVVSARAGHANPTVTLNIYAHLLPGQQEGAAAAFDVALRSALEE